MATDYPGTEHFEAVVTDRVVEDPWVISKVRSGERLLDVGSATSRFLQDLPEGCRAYAIDLRPTPPREGVTVVQGDLILAPFGPAASMRSPASLPSSMSAWMCTVRARTNSAMR